jgi:threonine/homoserine/homoserine lactone efflux protein
MKDAWFYLTLGVTLGFAAAVQPGPLLTYIISQTLKNGWRSTLPAAFAPLVSDIPIACVILLILSQVPVWLVQALRLAGGFFLLYLAYGAFKTWKNFTEYRPAEVQTGRQSLLKAATVNWLNPGPYLGWSLILGPLFLKGWRETPANGMAILVGFYASMVASMIGVIFLFSYARNLGARINRAMIGLTAIALAGFGVYQIWLGVSALWWK